MIPTANVALKIQPVRAGDFTLTAGGQGLFFLKGSQDGNPAGLGYGFASYKIPKLGTRSSSAAGTPRRATPCREARAAPWRPSSSRSPSYRGSPFAADWWSGENAIGYVTPGFYYNFCGHWTAYAAYSIKNGDSQGNAGLIELGYAF